MPTSSQALILHGTSGVLPPIFDRRTSGFLQKVWHPPPAWLDLFQPVATGYYNNRLAHSKDADTIIKKRVLGKPRLILGRSGSAPNLTSLQDIASILRVRGLRGSIPSEAGGLDWKISLMDPFYERTSKLRPPFRESPLSIFKHKNRELSKPISETARFLYTHANAREAEKENVEQISYVKFNSNVNGNSFAHTDDSREADYFRLVPSGFTSYSGHVTFRVEKCAKSTDGTSFRLRHVPSNGADEYILVAPEGYACADIRLVYSPDDDGKFVLLQEEENGEFKAVEVDPIETLKLPLTNESAKQRNIRKRSYESGVFNETKSGFENYEDNVWNRNGRSAKHISDRRPSSYAQALYGNNKSAHNGRRIAFDDSTDSTNHTEEKWSLPDIRISKSARLGNNQQSPIQHVTEAQIVGYLDDKSPTFLQGRRSPSVSDIDNEDYMETLRNESPEMYNKLLNLGFRRTRKEQVDSTIKAHQVAKDAERRIVASEWKTSDFDQWSRTTSVPTASQKQLEDGILKKLKQSVQDREEGHDEVKLKEACKQWKKKKIATIRMRRELPPKDPYSVVVRMNVSPTHQTLKKLIESETLCTVIGLQYDPISVHTSNPSSKNQWIIRFEDTDTCKRVVLSGLNIDSVKYSVRHFDDVMREEHEAYKFCNLVNSLINRKQKSKSKSRKNMSTTTHTQTAVLA
ncbi:uncharacterized protein LOC127849811 [Dreissena polymorpha]|uniref:Uncharacterized protein n=1 Tax=Dreissena polymorpha TaxID=45954 RepID=A0A9D4D4R0_DREPO|nr:uncharacterized protein LOC127849811 [Dreissena polymorpha]KAH3738134.1 hypothetical protein DPMN_044761 [Dreissena polymorpha]